MGTKQIQYKLLREFGEDLIREIQISDDPNEWDYAHYIMGYALGLIHALKLDKSEAKNINTEAKELTVRIAESSMHINTTEHLNSVKTV